MTVDELEALRDGMTPGKWHQQDDTMTYGEILTMWRLPSGSTSGQGWSHVNTDAYFHTVTEPEQEANLEAIVAIPAILSDAIATKRKLAEVEAENERLRGLCWFSWKEINTIAARDGAPEGVSEKWWCELQSMLEAVLGDDLNPWPSESAKAARAALGDAND